MNNDKPPRYRPPQPEHLARAWLVLTCLFFFALLMGFVAGWQ